MKRQSEPKRPPVHMIDREADVLTELAISSQDRQRQVSELLLEEISRATMYRADRFPDDVVSMNAQVEFIDAANGATRSVQLVYPKHADIAANKISILTPVGAGLIGLRNGQSIVWPDREGNERRLTIMDVHQGAPTGASA